VSGRTGVNVILSQAVHLKNEISSISPHPGGWIPTFEEKPAN
jgi:hypothetical protein